MTFMILDSFAKVRGHCFEPIAAFCVVRQNARNLHPETLRMVHFLHMTKLVHDNIIAHCLRRQQEQRIETDRAAAGTASPARTLCADGELRRMGAKPRRPFFQSCAEIHLRRFPELRQLLRRKRRSAPVAIPARKERAFFADPPLLARDKCVHLAPAHPARRAHQKTAVVTQLQANGAAIRKDQLVVHQ